ncbi:hypothetical protein KAR91_83765 [Candidatus Pacearchaeota archaeon]|nr:hypothetical protein [Candidatus Pacearchaeota archaeon]
MSIEFKVYPKVRNSEDRKFVSKLIMEDALRKTDNRLWRLQEKIHGANFSLKYNGEDYLQASKNRYVDGSGFYSSDTIMDKYAFAVKIIQERLGGTVEVFGEIYGGLFFPGWTYETMVAAVGKGVCYSPNREFACFDIKHNGEWLSESVVDFLCKTAGIPQVPVIKEGKLVDLLEISNEFRSLLPKRLGFTDDTAVENFAEGWILRPEDPFLLKNGNRAILKSKGGKWAEKAKLPRAQQQKKAEYPEYLQLKIAEFSRYVMPGRLMNVLSTLPDFSEGDWEVGKVSGMLQSALYQDVLKDWLEDGNALTFESKVGKKSFSREGMKPISKLVRDNVQKIINGEF